tara:strand:- start:36480 stop:36704 length:225 start_codon:yes stop_codon:yes gene_type:complete
MEKTKNEKAYNEEWSGYYEYLEALRQSGITNMFGAAPFLMNGYGMSEGEANNVLVSWMENYDALVSDGVISREA